MASAGGHWIKLESGQLTGTRLFVKQNTPGGVQAALARKGAQIGASARQLGAARRIATQAAAAAFGKTEAANAPVDAPTRAKLAELAAQGGATKAGAAKAMTANAMAREPGKGRVVQAFGANPGERYAVRYELREMGDLVTSNTDTGTINAAYPAELQPRDRTRAASRQQVENMARNMVPEAYTAEFSSLDRGAPIIGSDNVVESGNGRTMALRLAMRDNPEGYAAYKAAVKAAAEEKGLRPEDVDKFKNPVLVRVRVDEGVNRVEFARAANTSSMLGMSDTEKSATDATRLRPADVLGFKTAGEDLTADLRMAANRETVRNFVQSLPAGERATVMDRGGNLTQSGEKRIQAAMLTRVYNDPRLTDHAFESTDDDTKTLTRGLMASLPAVARSEERVRTGERAPDLSIAADIRAAVAKYQGLRETGQSPEDYLNQHAMFADQDLSGTQRRILAGIHARRRSAKALSEWLASWANAVEREPNPNQASMFGDPGRSREQLLNEWLKLP